MDGFHKMNPKTKHVFETVDSPFVASVSKPAYGCWIDVAIEGTIDLQLYTNGIHAIQHAILNIAPAYATSLGHLHAHCCGYNGSLSKILIYEAQARKTPIVAISQYLATILMRSKKMLEACECRDGCEKCIEMHSCPSRNKCISRRDALHVLDLLLKWIQIYLFSSCAIFYRSFGNGTKIGRIQRENCAALW